MDKSNFNARARSIVIDILHKKYKSNDVYSRALSNGFIPIELQEEYNLELDNLQAETVDNSELELMTLSNWFAMNPDKIIGQEVIGSGFINPVITKGNINDIQNVINYGIDQDFNKKETVISEPKEEAIIEEKEYKMENKSIDISEQLLVLGKLKEQEQANKNKTNQSELLTIDESLKLYNPNISEAEIKGWVYYKRMFGNPMRGWERYYLSNSTSKDKLIFSKEAFYLKDQMFKDVKLIPSDTLIGKKTRFKNEYAGLDYYVVKTENNELYYVPENKVKEKETFNSVSENELMQLVKQKGICYNDGEFIPIPFYTYGNIYEIKDKLIGKFNSETRAYEGGYIDDIKAKFGQEIADWHLELVDLAIKNKGEYYFDDPTETNRPYLAKENPISDSFKIKELNLESGVNFEKLFDERKNRNNKSKKYDTETTYSLFEAYLEWFRINVSDSDLTDTTKSNIIDYYFYNRNVAGGKEMTDKEKDSIRLNARVSGEKIYGKFLATALLKEDLFLLNQIFNRTYNSISKLNLDKVPVAFETNKKVFNIDFKLKPVQRDGIAFMSATNSGCLAYDVGFGKTLTAIHNLASLLKQGKVKRPLIAVPKPVYNNWIREMFGYWTDGQNSSFEKFEGARFINGALTGTNYKLNSWFNMSDKISYKNELVDADTITLVSYEGFYKIGFSDKLTEELFEGIYSILDTGKTDMTEREQSKSKEKVMKFLGIGVKETVVDIDICGFDYLVFDEAHAFKNVFNSVPLGEEQKNVWRLSQKAEPTRRAVKCFFHCLYIQKKYGGNVNLLTATPFTNSPLEIFSMLALVGYETLSKYNLQNLYEFLTLFIETQVEYTVDATNNIVMNTVIKSFKNKNLLRDILYRHFDYQDNPTKSDIKRPCKINFPNSKVSTFLEMSELQLEAQQLVKSEAKSYSRENLGAMIRALGWAKNNAFSPYLVPSIEKYQDLDELVENSPKLKYTIEAINSVKNWHESKGQSCSGQVVYANRGKELFPDIKKAIEEYCGFKRKIKYGDDTVDEVEIITGGGTDAEVERKEVIKDAFNAGIIKVIIGTSTIKEGVNLQKRGTVLYHLDLDWNPSDFKQIEGRIFRQGNLFKYVRIVVPMVQNTLDSFINQKLDEKGKRIATIWDKDNKANTIEENNAVDPMELKFALIDDPEELYKMKHDKEHKSAEKESQIAMEKFQAIDIIDRSVNNFKSELDYLNDDIRKTFDNHKAYSLYLKRFIENTNNDNTDRKKAEDVLEKVKENIVLFDEYYENANFKSLFECIRNLKVKTYAFYRKDGSYLTFEKLRELEYAGTGTYFYGEPFNKISEKRSKSLIAEYGNMKKLERMVLQPYGLSVDDDFSEIKDRFRNEANSKAQALTFYSTAEYRETAMYEIEMELQKRRAERGTVYDRVNQFAETNYLLSYPFDDKTADECNLPISEDNSGEIDHVLEQGNSTEIQEDITKTKLSSTDIKNDKDVSESVVSDKELKEILFSKLQRLKPFIPNNQYKIISKQVDILEFEEPINRLFDTVNNMPVTYQQDGLGNRQYAFLHYFFGNSDWYITEKDKGNKFDKTNPDSSETMQCFGYADLGYGGEFGYISVDEIKNTDVVELDLYFDIKPIYEISKDEPKNIDESGLEDLLKVEAIVRKIKGIEIVSEPVEEPKEEQDDAKMKAKAKAMARIRVRKRILELKNK
jgi:hypothetical protein